MFELVLRIGVSLLIVLGLMWGLARVARRPLAGNRGSGSLAVLTRQPLGRNASVAVVQVAEKALVLGVTDSRVTLLGETDLAAFEKPSHPQRTHRAAIPLELAGTPDYEFPELSPVGPVTSRLDGSVLSPRTWVAVVEFLRERTTRR